MPHYKTPQNAVHFLTTEEASAQHLSHYAPGPEDADGNPTDIPVYIDGAARWLPADCVPITDEEAALLASPLPTLDQLIAAKNVEINTARAAANIGRFEHAGLEFSCDALSRGDIDGVNGYVAITGALPPTFPGAWKATDNSYLALPDVPSWTAFYGAMVAAGTAHFVRSEQLKAALATATTPEAVAAIVW